MSRASSCWFVESLGQQLAMQAFRALAACKMTEGCDAVNGSVMTEDTNDSKFSTHKVSKQ